MFSLTSRNYSAHSIFVSNLPQMANLREVSFSFGGCVGATLAVAASKDS